MYCSNQCHAESKRIWPEVFEKPCLICGTITLNDKFCSLKCFGINRKGKKMPQISKGLTGRKLSEEHIKNSSRGRIGKTPSWALNPQRKIEVGQRISLALIGNKNCAGKNKEPETIAKAVAKNTGKKRTEQQKENIRQGHLNSDYVISEETRKLQGQRPQEHWQDPEYRSKLSGENAPNWQGGTSLEEYGLEWTNELRNEIRLRDNFICCDCGIKQDEIYRKIQLHIHHVDFNKKNCSKDNLIALCGSCHMKRHRKIGEILENYISYSEGIAVAC